MLKFINRNGLKIFITLSIATILACTSNGGGEVGEDDSTPTLEQGVFLDSRVQGIAYKTATQSGLTDANGTFKYQKNESVSFYLGDILLGAGTGRRQMTPIDLVPGAAGATHPTVTNICRLLQSLDQDGNLDNGIQITERISNEVSGRPIDFSLTIESFAASDSVTDLFVTLNALNAFSDTNERCLCSAEKAREHLNDTLNISEEEDGGQSDSADSEDCGNFIGNWSTEYTYRYGEYSHGVLSITSDGKYYYGELSYTDGGSMGGYDDLGADFYDGTIVILSSGTYRKVEDYLEVSCDTCGDFGNGRIWGVMCGITLFDHGIDFSHLGGQSIITAFLDHNDDCSFDELESCDENQVILSKASGSISPAIDSAVSVYNMCDSLQLAAPSNVTAEYKEENAWNYITWDEVPCAVQYKIYWETEPFVTETSERLNPTNSLEYAHTGVMGGYTYYYRVAAVDDYGNESELSEQVSADVHPNTSIYPDNGDGKPDLIISNVVPGPYTFEYPLEYTLTITNIGEAAVDLNGPTGDSLDNVAIQTFLSENNSADYTDDIPAGGTILGFSLPVLNTGESYSMTWYYSFDFDTESMPYLKIVADWQNIIDESDEDNNVSIFPVDELIQNTIEEICGDHIDNDQDGEIDEGCHKCYPQLTAPNLEYLGPSSLYLGSDGQYYRRYRITVTNYDDYPDALFSSAPHLPPCGLNTDSSRSWVEIYDNSGNRIYGFCGFSSPDNLTSLWFATPDGVDPPQSVYIEIIDRECNRTYTSNLAVIQDDADDTDDTD